MSNKKYSDIELTKAVAEATNYSQVQRILTSGRSGSVYMHIKKRIIKLGLDTSHFNSYISNKNKGGNNKIPKEEILVLKPVGFREKSARLRRAMLEHNFLYKCSMCGLSNWLGETITLEIDHIDGCSNNNLPDNLRFLCPNCHTQTDTYGYKGKVR